MAANLEFGSQVIADIANGDVYNRVNHGNRPSLEVRRITFPGTKGAELNVIGNQQAAANSLVIKYGTSRGKQSFIIKANETAMDTHISNIDTFRLNQDNLTGTLKDTLDTAGLTGMRWTSFNTSDPYPIGSGATVCVFFEATFERVTPP